VAQPEEVTVYPISPLIHIFHMRECDPKKCTALKLERLGLAKVYYSINRLPTNSILLYPFAKEVLSPLDRQIALSRGISAIDCSWNKIEELPQLRRFNARQLPFMLAANPVNYSIPLKLSTLEALSGALYITGFIGEARFLLSKVKWGETFLTLNREPLDLYSSARDLEEVKRLSDEYRKVYNI
jgi:pre-rRNA-processing protein TSR3